MARQYLVPGGVYLHETGTAEYLVPGGAYVDETVPGGINTNITPRTAVRIG